MISQFNFLVALVEFFDAEYQYKLPLTGGGEVDSNEIHSILRNKYVVS